ncbi:hypothetical protein ACR91H_25935 [Klebsiella pneumoniae]
MSLLDKVKNAAKQVPFGNEELNTGIYKGKLVSIKHDTIKEQYEVYRFWYKIKANDSEYILTDTMFVNEDPDKTETQVSFRIKDPCLGGAVSPEALEKAMSNLDGFFEYYVKQMANYEVAVKLYDDKYKGNVNRKIAVSSVKPANAAVEKKDDLPF